MALLPGTGSRLNVWLQRVDVADEQEVYCTVAAQCGKSGSGVGGEALLVCGVASVPLLSVFSSCPSKIETIVTIL